MGFLRQAGQWLAAGLLAVLLCNGLLYGYHNPAAWIRREQGATYAIWNPDSTHIMGTEGRGVHPVDARGYLNPRLPLAEEYTLVVGSSFTQGKEVAAGQRFVDLMNAQLSDGKTLAVYGVSQDGFYLPDVVKCFPALLAEFPGAKTIVLEIGTTACSEEALSAALNQRAPDLSCSGDGIFARMSAGQRAVLWFKETFPILTLAKSQLTAMLDREVAPEETPASPETLDKALGLVRSQFAGRILVLYHPEVEITPEGKLAIWEEESLEPFRQACRRNGLSFLDTSEAFLAAYARDFAVPYGFSNTAMGIGHLNADGHRLCAQVLLEALKGGGV